MSETEDDLRASAASHDWSLEGIDIFELVPPESLLDEDQQQSLLYSSDLELGETTKRVFEAFERVRPSRVVLDSLSEIRLLAQSSLRYRRQILALKHYFARSGATVLMLDDLSSEANDRTVHSVAHGVIRLEELSPEYGAERRRLRVIKYRGQRYRGGYHDFVIATGGVGRRRQYEARTRFEELDDLAKDLERRVEERTAEHEATVAQLHEVQKLETLGQLTGGVAHDFNNLLTPITGALDPPLQANADTDARSARLLGNALKAADWARTLVPRLLGFARRQTLQTDAIDIVRLIAGMRDLIASSIGPTIEIAIEPEADLPLAVADPNQLELAILNLCVNARDAMPDGGG